MVNSRGMEMAVVRVGGFSSSGITNSISYYHINHKQGAWRQLTSVPHVECCNFGAAVLHNLLYVVGGAFNQVGGCLQENIHPFGFCYNPRQDKWNTLSAMIRWWQILKSITIKITISVLGFDCPGQKWVTLLFKDPTLWFKLEEFQGKPHPIKASPIFTTW